MNVSLPPELERLVEQRVKAGSYSSADDVVREGLEFFFAHERELAKQPFSFSSLQELEEKLMEGIRQLDRGEGIPLEKLRRRT